MTAPSGSTTEITLSRFCTSRPPPRKSRPVVRRFPPRRQRKLSPCPPEVQPTYSSFPPESALLNRSLSISSPALRRDLLLCGIPARRRNRAISVDRSLGVRPERCQSSLSTAPLRSHKKEPHECDKTNLEHAGAGCGSLCCQQFAGTAPAFYFVVPAGPGAEFQQ
jgi:hypothetical protein